MSQNRRRLQAYLKASSESKKKQNSKPGRCRTDKDEFVKVSAPHAARTKSAGEGGKLSENASHDRLTNVTPPPELGDNLNA